MPTDQLPSARASSAPAANQASRKRQLSGAAERALAEAAARRGERNCGAGEQSKELNGRGGLDPTRYGDWEVNGLASDF
jgi:hypothetical protein